jgi:peptide-methionine (R)-S-oxide reductase
MKKTFLSNLYAGLLAGTMLIPSLTSANGDPVKKVADGASPGGRRVIKTDAEWKKTLTPEQYYILREHGTERAFTSPLNDIHAHGTFVCAACKNPLFSSDTKFDSGTGWPSFYKPIAKDAVKEKVDRSYGMARTEIMCSVCDGHLGHVFDDGPKPTGLRYCMNGAGMLFEKK